MNKTELLDFSLHRLKFKTPASAPQPAHVVPKSIGEKDAVVTVVVVDRVYEVTPAHFANKLLTLGRESARILDVRGGIAKLVRQRLAKPCTIGSSPIAASIFLFTVRAGGK